MSTAICFNKITKNSRSRIIQKMYISYLLKRNDIFHICYYHSDQEYSNGFSHDNFTSNHRIIKYIPKWLIWPNGAFLNQEEKSNATRYKELQIDHILHDMLSMLCVGLQRDIPQLYCESEFAYCLYFRLGGGQCKKPIIRP